MKNNISYKSYRCAICKKYHKGKRYISPSLKKQIPLSLKKYICPSCYSIQLLKIGKKINKFDHKCQVSARIKKKFAKQLSNTKYTTIDIIRSHKASLLNDKNSLTKNFMVDVCCVLTTEEIDVVLKKMFKKNIK